MAEENKTRLLNFIAILKEKGEFLVDTEMGKIVSRQPDLRYVAEYISDQKSLSANHGLILEAVLKSVTYVHTRPGNS